MLSDARYLSSEPTSCWFDYAHLSPFDRTQAFVDAYCQAYRQSYGRRKDIVRAQHIKPIPTLKDGKLSSLSGKYRTCAWKSRQAADALEIPYPQYCHFIIDAADKHGWTHLPQINQMYSAPLQQIALNAWDLYTQHHLLLPESPSSSQKFFQYLQKVSQRRLNPHLLVHHLLKQQMISAEHATQVFGADLVKQAQMG
jgi:hypothetical protein